MNTRYYSRMINGFCFCRTSISTRTVWLHYQFRSLHPYVSQHLVSLFETLAKKYSQLADQIQQHDSEGSTPDTILSMEDTDQPSDLVRHGSESLHM